MILEKRSVRLCTPDSHPDKLVQGIRVQQRSEEHSNAKYLLPHFYLLGRRGFAGIILRNDVEGTGRKR